MDMLRSPPNVLEKASTSYNEHMQLHNSQVPTLYSILYLFCFLFISFVVLLDTWGSGTQGILVGQTGAFRTLHLMAKV